MQNEIHQKRTAVAVPLYQSQQLAFFNILFCQRSPEAHLWTDLQMYQFFFCLQETYGKILLPVFLVYMGVLRLSLSLIGLQDASFLLS